MTDDGVSVAAERYDPEADTAPLEKVDKSYSSLLMLHSYVV